MTPEEMKKEIDSLKQEIKKLAIALAEFQLHRHNGYDSDRVSLRDVIGEYQYFIRNKYPNF